MYTVTVRPSRVAHAEVKRLYAEVDFQSHWIALVRAGEYPVANPGRSIRIARQTIRRARARIAEMEQGA